TPADAHAPPGWLLALYSAGAVAGLIAAGRFLLRPLFRLIGHLGEREMFIFAALFTVAGAAAVMTSLGLSPALGAFVAGVMLADTPYRHELETDVEPFRSVLIGLFFLSVGMLLDLHAIAERPLFVVGMAAALIAAKAGIVFGIALALRMGWRPALALGLLLSQGGEFGFVLFAQAQAGGLVAPQAASLFGAIITLSMATTPFLMSVTRRFRAAPPRPDETREGPQADGASALVVGYGRFGQTVAQMLIAQDIPVTLIDTDTQMIDVAGEFGAKVYYGDGTRLDLLRQAGGADAALILFCLDGDQLDAALLAGVAEAFPKATLFVRAYDRRAVIRLAGAPIEYATREVLESAVQMARRAMDSLGVDGPDIDRAEDRYRRTDRERLRVQVATGDLRAARDMVPRQGERQGEREGA
uniref:cation:proton antiporter domain-containing protein n=1 Tax=Sphingomonas bacterium TaxID=1895847 RepID=UPI001576F50D